MADDEKDYWQEYLKMMEGRTFTEGSRMLTKEEFYKNFPDCKPTRKRGSRPNN
jgi:hypothetical protein